MDRHLIVCLLLPIAAVGINTIVGFIVAHRITVTGSKVTGYLVSLVSLALCVTSALLAFGVYRQLTADDDTQPKRGRRLFMAKLDLLLAGLATVAILAGILVLITLHPND